MRSVLVLVLCSGLALGALAQSAPATPAGSPKEDISGMYTFLHNGEFVQITIEEAVTSPAPTPAPKNRLSTSRTDSRGNVSGFISRFGDSKGDQGAFLDQFIKQGSYDGKKLSFVTETVHGAGYEFAGTVERGPGKTPGDEAYYLLKGTLVIITTDADHKTARQSREVEFKSFPREAMGGPQGFKN